MCRPTSIEMKEMLISFFIGVVIGVLGVFFGDSYIPSFFLEGVTGIGWVFLVEIGIAIVALIYFQLVRRPPVRWTREIIGRVTRVCVDASFALFGVVLVAFSYWLHSGSQTALGVVLHGMLLAAVLAYVGWGLRSWLETLHKQ